MYAVEYTSSHEAYYYCLISKEITGGDVLKQTARGITRSWNNLKYLHYYNNLGHVIWHQTIARNKKTTRWQWHTKLWLHSLHVSKINYSSKSGHINSLLIHKAIMQHAVKLNMSHTCVIRKFILKLANQYSLNFFNQQFQVAFSCRAQN